MTSLEPNFLSSFETSFRSSHSQGPGHCEGDSVCALAAKNETWYAAIVSMERRDIILTAEATIVRRDGVSEIDADDMGALLAKVPEGFQLLNVREA